MVASVDFLVVVVDNTIREKPHSRENELICWLSIKTLAEQDQSLTDWLRRMDDSVLLLKIVFKNEDSSQVVRFPDGSG